MVMASQDGRGQTNRMDDEPLDQAIAWHLALASDDVDWEAFTAWLEADPDRRHAYDEVTLIEDAVERHRGLLAGILPAETADAPEPHRRRRRIAAWAVIPVAAALLLVLQPILRTKAPPPPEITYATGQGETREIALADGARIALAPRSRLAVEAQDRLSLVGAATFDVPHRPDRALVVRAGGVSVQDIGTRFEIASAPGSVRVEVAEGEVAASLPSRDVVGVKAGQSLTLASGQTPDVRPLGAGAFASWRQGRLVYDDAPLALVAADLSRYSGSKVTLDTALRGRRFSGVLPIGDGSKLVGTFATIMDLEIQPAHGSLRLVPRRRP